MSKFSPIADQPLGSVLQQAGLVSQEQIQIALHRQQQTNQRIGKILAAQGWIKQASADFFAESWPQLINRSQQQSIGQYLKQAALLDDKQIETILAQQQDRELKFGTLAVLNGWVRHQTISFFLQHMGSLELDAPQSIPEHRQPQRDEDPTFISETANPFALLQLYRQILEQGSVDADGSPEQAELLKTGLVVLVQNQLELAQFEPEFEADLDDSDHSFPVELGFDQPRPYDHIRLRLFNLESCSARPYRLFSEVLGWTGNQPALTQKLCQVIRSGSFIPAGLEADQVASQVHHCLIHDWESSAAAEPLRTLRDRLFKSQYQPEVLLQLYNRCLEQTYIPVTGSPEEQELLQLGLLAETDGKIHVANKLYRFVFNRDWVAQMQQTLTVKATQVADLTNSRPSDSPASALLVGNEPSVIATPSSKAFFQLSKKAFWLGLGAVVAGFLTVAGLRSCQDSEQTPTVSTSPSLNVQSLPGSPKPESPQRVTQPSQGAMANIGPSSAPQKAPADRSLSSRRNGAGPATLPVHSLRPIPVFVTGSDQAQILNTLGKPTWNRQGYFPNSRAWLYKGKVSKHIDLGYLLSATTGRLRQTEAAFDPSISLATIQTSLREMLKGTLPIGVQRQLQAIYQHRLSRYTFLCQDLEGEIHRDSQGWIYIGIWDADFH